MPEPQTSDAEDVRDTTEQNREVNILDLSLAAHCSEDAPRTVRFLTGAVMACGGCVLSRRFDASESAAIEFEFTRATCIEMYSLLIAAGLELSPQSHHILATLCQCTRETLQVTAADPVRVELTIRSTTPRSPDEPDGSSAPPNIA